MSCLASQFTLSVSCDWSRVVPLPRQAEISLLLLLGGNDSQGVHSCTFVWVMLYSDRTGTTNLSTFPDDAGPSEQITVNHHHEESLVAILLRVALQKELIWKDFYLHLSYYI